MRARRFAFSAFVLLALPLAGACASKPKTSSTTSAPPATPPGDHADSDTGDAGATGPTLPSGDIRIDELAGFQATAGAHTDEDDAAWLASHVKPVSVDCLESADTAGVLSLPADVDASREGDELVTVSLAYGVVAILARDPLKLAITPDPIAACEGSQTELLGAWAGQIVADPDQEIVVLQTEGGRNINVTTLTIFKRRAAAFVPIYSQDLREEEAGQETTHTIELPALDRLTSDGATSAWSLAEFRFSTP